MSLTVSIIGKNEQRYIGGCLESAMKVADQIVYMDTGSTDATMDIARDMIGKENVFQTSWKESFAQARNEADDKAKCDWVMWMDCDDRIKDRESEQEILKLKKDKAVCGFRFRTVNAEKNDVALIGGVAHNDLLRMYPREYYSMRPRWRGRVHENIEHSLVQWGATVYDASNFIQIVHVGYTTSDIVAKKVWRNFRLAMYDAGYPVGTKFFEFELPNGVRCFYHPNWLIVGKYGHEIARVEPFKNHRPENRQDAEQWLRKYAQYCVRAWEQEVITRDGAAANALLLEKLKSIANDGNLVVPV